MKHRLIIITESCFYLGALLTPHLSLSVVLWIDDGSTVSQKDDTISQKRKLLK